MRINRTSSDRDTKEEKRLKELGDMLLERDFLKNIINTIINLKNK